MERAGSSESSSKASVRSSACSCATDFLRECEWLGAMGAEVVLLPRPGSDESLEGGFGEDGLECVAGAGAGGAVGRPRPRSVPFFCGSAATDLVERCEDDFVDAMRGETDQGWMALELGCEGAAALPMRFLRCGRSSISRWRGRLLRRDGS